MIQVGGMEHLNEVQGISQTRGEGEGGGERIQEGGMYCGLYRALCVGGVATVLCVRDQFKS